MEENIFRCLTSSMMEHTVQQDSIKADQYSKSEFPKPVLIPAPRWNRKGRCSHQQVKQFAYMLKSSLFKIRRQHDIFKIFQAVLAWGLGNTCHALDQERFGKHTHSLVQSDVEKANLRNVPIYVTSKEIKKTINVCSLA